MAVVRAIFSQTESETCVHYQGTNIFLHSFTTSAVQSVILYTYFHIYIWLFLSFFEKVFFLIQLDTSYPWLVFQCVSLDVFKGCTQLKFIQREAASLQIVAAFGEISSAQTNIFQVQVLLSK